MDSFESIWATLRDRYWDPAMGGKNWQAVHDRYERKLQSVKNADSGEELLDRLIHELPSSHLSIIPAWMYGPNGMPSDPKTGDTSGATDEEGSVGLTVTVIDGQVVIDRIEPDSAAMRAGIHTGWIVESVANTPMKKVFRSLHVTPLDAKARIIEEVVQSWLSGPLGSSLSVSLRVGNAQPVAYVLPRLAGSGKLVQFGNLPPEHVSLEHRRLPNGAGYLRLNLFLDPVTVMPSLETALREFRDAPGVVFDLRNNPGGVGMMAMGIAGWFVSQPGLRLGTMIYRDGAENFDINPRLEAFPGRLAIVVNGGSASTTEILAQGLQDLGRARIFGTRTAGAALPSEIIELPNGDRFEYPEANYVSVKGRILESNGVQPDVVIAPTVDALLAGRDLPLEAAGAWVVEQK
jgi:carboxyl-terminal processing protease